MRERKNADKTIYSNDIITLSMCFPKVLLKQRHWLFAHFILRIQNGTDRKTDSKHTPRHLNLKSQLVKRPFELNLYKTMKDNF